MRARAILVVLLAISTAVTSMPSELPSYRKIWQSWSSVERTRFLEGYSEGWMEGVDEALPTKFPIDEDKLRHRLDLQVSVNLGANLVRELVDHFYSDPANDLVPFGDAIRLSIANYRGEDISERLRRVRQLGVLLDQHKRQEGAEKATSGRPAGEKP